MNDASHDNGNPPPRKMTKAEAGRLGGEPTEARHGTEQFRRAGKLGFAALARARGYTGGSRLGALQWLRRTGRITDTPAQAQAEADARAWVESYLDAHLIAPEVSDHE